MTISLRAWRGIALCTLLLLVYACGRTGSSERLHQLVRQAAFAPDWHTGDSVANVILEKARHGAGPEWEGYGLYLHAQFHSGEPLDTIYQWIDRAQACAEEVESDSLLSMLYNMRGCFAMSRQEDFPAARRHFTKAMYYGEQAGARDLQMIAQSNLSDSYSMAGDTLGILPDRETFEYACRQGNDYMKSASAYHCAAYYLSSPIRSGHPERALPYIKAIREAGDSARADMLTGVSLLLTGKLADAASLLNKALANAPASSEAHFYKAWLLYEQGRHEVSLQMLDSVEALYARHKHSQLIPAEVDFLRFQNYKGMGRTPLAMQSLERYAARRDSLAKARAGEDAARMRVVYDVERKEAAIVLQKEQLKQRTIIFVAIIAALILGLGGYLLWRHQRTGLYRAIVKLSNPSLPPLPLDDNAAEEPEQAAPAGTLSAAKAQKIWSDIEHEIIHNKLYADPRTSRDSFAEKIGVNHTWFSQVIKERTGMTYLQYINSCRVSEAVRLMRTGDAMPPVAELARQLGFMSPATFYKAFKQQMGLTPAAYLSTLRQLQ